VSPSPSAPSGERDTTTLVMQGDAGFAASCLRLFQKGFFVSVGAGSSVRSLLHDVLGLEPAYIEQRITTIFLDGKPVDDPDGATPRDGGTLSLSGAMPGLVGAAMRRSGPVAALRASITFGRLSGEVSGRALVRVKLFNMVLNDIGPGFLVDGVLLRTAELVDFLKEQPVPPRPSCAEALIDGAPVPISTLAAALRTEFTRFSVSVQPPADCP
jgi:hypothetical protein